MPKKRAAELEGMSHALREGRGLQALERLARLAAALFESSTSVILFNQAGVSRIITGKGLKAHYLSYRWDYKDAPYKPDERYIKSNALDHDKVQQSSVFLGGGRVGFFVRVPVTVAASYTITLIVCDTEPKPEPDGGDLKLLDDLVALIGEEMRDLVPLLSEPDAHVSVAATLDDLIARTEKLTVPAALLSSEIRIVAINAQAAKALQVPPSELIGRSQFEVMPRSSEIFRQFYLSALADKLSTPAIEITTDETPDAQQRTYSIVATPLSPVGTDDYFLLVTATDITSRTAREDLIDAAVQKAASATASASEPTAQFLFDTLVERRTIRNRNSISYMTLRSWRLSIRKYQISAIKALKDRLPAAFADDIAEEIADGVAGLVGTAAFKIVVPVPCGHSKSKDCLSVAIARSLAARLGLPMVCALESLPRQGRSHPKKNAARPPMTLAHPVLGPVLLIDDVATSGAHLEEAVELLKPHSGSVLPVAWIGGDAKSD